MLGCGDFVTHCEVVSAPIEDKDGGGGDAAAADIKHDDDDDDDEEDDDSEAAASASAAVNTWSIRAFRCSKAEMKPMASERELQAC